MTTVSENPILSLRALSERAPFKYEWLLAAAEWRDNPLPTIKRGRHQVIIYSDFCDWLRTLYGPGGIMRGQEEMNPKGLK
jgi:hypothetical protein